MKPLKVGFLGLGTVGTGVVRLLEQNRTLIEEKAGVTLQAARALVRDASRTRDLGGVQLELVTDPAQVVDDPEIDLVVEALGGAQPAASYLLRALRNGKPVVTANKDAVAEHGTELFAAAAAGGTDLWFEASVGGGIPIIRPLKESLAANRVRAVMGIINGTTNYILTKMSREGLDFETALAQAQDLGYAEPDPSNDVGGKDAARKLAILASLAFRTHVTPDQVYTEGITRVSSRDIEFGRRLGWTLKLLAIAKEAEGAVEVRVHPTFIPSRHPLAAVNDSLNAIFVDGDALGEAMFLGRGAGAGPTASSILGDLIAAARSLQLLRLLPPGVRREVAASVGGGLGSNGYAEKPIRPMADVRTRTYLRLTVADQPGVLARVAAAFGEAGVSMAHILQTPDEERGTAEIALVTHTVTESRIEAALTTLSRLPEVQAVDSRIRIEL